MSAFRSFAHLGSPVKKTISYVRLAGTTVVVFMAALALSPHTATAQQTKPVASSAFSFAVYGDLRSMMYLPYKSDQKEEATKLMVDMFELVLPEKVRKTEACARRACAACDGPPLRGNRGSPVSATLAEKAWPLGKAGRREEAAFSGQTGLCREAVLGRQPCRTRALCTPLASRVKQAALFRPKSPVELGSSPRGPRFRTAYAATELRADPLFPA